MSLAPLPVFAALAEFREAALAARRSGAVVGVVPTMGALHAGHLSLVRAARAECSYVTATIFVNPTQFGPQEDFACYPRPLARDLELLAGAGCDAVFTPTPEEMYPPGFSTYVEPPAAAAPWEGALRPGHFRGVATVVLKLLHAAAADFAYFGQKDYQQSVVVRRMVADLAAPVAIRVCPTIREADGLALSSRNAYLLPDERRRGLALWRALTRAAELHRGGERSGPVLRRAMQAELEAAPVDRIDYATVVDPETLAELETLAGPAVALVAARLGGTRLLDNLRLG